MTKLFISSIALLAFTSCMAQKKQQQPITIALYNCENFFDTKDDPTKNDDDFLPDAATKWDEKNTSTNCTKWLKFSTQQLLATPCLQWQV